MPEWKQLDDQLTRTFIFSVALNSVNALEPKERGVVFLVTLALLTVLLSKLSTPLTARVEAAPNGVPLEIKLLAKLVEHFLEIAVSLFSTASGLYVSGVMGTTIVDRPVYSLTITSLIVSVLYLVKTRINTTRNERGSA